MQLFSMVRSLPIVHPNGTLPLQVHLRSSVDILDIGELAARSGLPASTLRYYDEIGLITSIGRRGLRRQFGPEAFWQLGLIALGKKAGFSLAEIATMFAANGASSLPRAALHARAGEIDRQIHELTVLRDMLRHVAECSAPTHLACPRFRKLLRIAGRHQKGHG
ncbi:DNA-binding transcriptional MerR regulator [Chelatococcus caeni]|uniref:DNA-binding transcriptional MerR regulator n=1 Tax=Chelatococcus caeni TaxID=1348468 RepID=A0A840BPL4_9HYPH|nr:DNA-binding transcriptional MerR regulator [Chelatococcus caeni]